MFCINVKENSLCQKMHIGKGIVCGLVEKVLSGTLKNRFVKQIRTSSKFDQVRKGEIADEI